MYALFFAVAGADLSIDVLRNVWAFALFILLIRGVALMSSTALGGALAGDPAVVRRSAWMGFLSQAGVTLGIAALVAERFEGFGPDVSTIIIAMIAVNELIGPPAFRYALVRSGESRKQEGAPSPSPQAARH